MTIRLLGLYTLVVLTMETLGAVTYHKILPVTGHPLTMTNLQLGIGATLVAVASVLGLAVGYNEIEFTTLGASIIGVVGFALVAGLLDYHYYNAVGMVGATVAAGFLARLADYAIVSIELNSYNIDFGRI